MLPIGDRLRDARRSQGLDITECESATKIRARYLMALEEERFEALPEPAYVRGMVRAYAEFLGLDPAPLLDELAARGPRPDHAIPGDLRVRAPVPARRPRRGGLADARLAWMLLGGACVAGVLVWLGAAGRGGPEPVAPLRSIPAATAPPTTAVPPPTRTVSPAGPAAPARDAALRLRGLPPGGSWVQVRRASATGEVLYEGTLAAGVSRRFALGRGLWIRVGWGPGLRAVAAGRAVALPDGTGDLRVTRSGAVAPAVG